VFQSHVVGIVLRATSTDQRVQITMFRFAILIVVSLVVRVAPAAQLAGLRHYFQSPTTILAVVLTDVLVLCTISPTEMGLASKNLFSVFLATFSCVPQADRYPVYRVFNRSTLRTH